MRKVILCVALSLDALIEGPNGEFDWCFPPPKEEMANFMNRIDAVFLGRKSYELTQKMGESAGMPQLETYVFSNTLDRVEGATLIKGDLKAQVESIKSKEGKDIWLFGGSSLTTSFLNLGLVEEMWLAVHPIILGAGKPLFQNIKSRNHLVLTDSKIYPSGLVSLYYEFKKNES